MKQILAQAETPFGSMYHFFPDGKEQLAEEMLRTGGDFFLRPYQETTAEAPDFRTAIEQFFIGAGETLVATDHLDACPIATVAGEIA